MNQQEENDKKNGPVISAVQISGMNAAKQYILAVITKKTYAFDFKGRCHAVEMTEGLAEDLEFYPDSPELMSQDSDLYCVKPFTDVILQGKARNHSRTREFTASLSINGRDAEFLVIGKRNVYLDSTGRIQFTPPEYVHEVPLRYDYAYGGKDLAAEEKLEQPPDEILRTLPPDSDWKEGNPFRYPRNPCGKGYIVEFKKSSLEQLELPNLEDPIERLTPDNLVLMRPERWINMPVPRCTDWVNPIWFPRLAYFGFVHKPIDLSVVPTEIKRNWANKEILSDVLPHERFNLRCANGASLGLQLPYLKGSEIINLKNIHPEISNFQLKLPNEVPQIWVDGRNGTLKPTSPIVHTVVIRPEEKSVDIVWCGIANAIRPYLEDELKDMPFKVKW